MAFPTTPVLDAFNRSNENPLADGNWSGPTISGNDECQIISNIVEGTGNGAETCGSYWSATAFNADQEAYCDLVTENTDDGGYESYWCDARITNPNTVNETDGYEIEHVTGHSGADKDQIRIYRIDDDVYTQLGANMAQVAADGDKLGIECVGDTLTAYHKTSAGAWTSKGTRDGSAYNNAGNIALGIYEDFSAGSMQLDNFGGGDIAGVEVNHSFDNEAAWSLGVKVYTP